MVDTSGLCCLPELQRPRVGRKARITRTIEEMLPPEVIE
jgi:hypothetical protein